MTLAPEEIVKIRCIKAIEDALVPTSSELGFITSLPVATLADKIGFDYVKLNAIRKGTRKKISVGDMFSICKGTDTPVFEVLDGLI